MLLLRRRYSDSTLCLPNHSHHSLSLSLSITLSSRTYFLSIYYSITYSLYLHVHIIFLSTTLSHTLYIFTYLLYFSYTHCILSLVFLPTTSFSLYLSITLSHTLYISTYLLYFSHSHCTLSSTCLSSYHIIFSLYRHPLSFHLSCTLHILSNLSLSQYLCLFTSILSILYFSNYFASIATF